MRMAKKVYPMILAMALWSMLWTGCGKEDIYLVRYSSIQEGVSTKQDVMALYGRPKFVLPRRDGTEQWSYEAETSGDFSDKQYNFDFTFDKNGTVINKSKFTSKWP